MTAILTVSPVRSLIYLGQVVEKVLLLVVLSSSGSSCSVALSFPGTTGISVRLKELHLGVSVGYELSSPISSTFANSKSF